ncbi:MAG: WbqC family protein [Bacteroides sp.]|nr:WbqC family protein [Bacteroides sp.]
MENILLLTSAYLAPVHYYSKIYHYPTVQVEQHEHYIKQTLRNRCIIASANGPQPLSIPVIKPDSPKTPMKDIRISDHGNWRHLHWNAIESACSSTPFFEYYRDYFQPFYEKKIGYLIDFNKQLCELVCRLIDLPVILQRTESYQKEPPSTVIDLREQTGSRKEFSFPDPEYQAIPYYQVFQEKQGFLPGMSIMDLLFNMGPESLLILEKSVRR